MPKKRVLSDKVPRQLLVIIHGFTVSRVTLRVFLQGDRLLPLGSLLFISQLLEVYLRLFIDCEEHVYSASQNDVARRFVYFLSRCHAKEKEQTGV